MTTRSLTLAVAACALTFTACASDDPTPNDEAIECGGHGHLHGGHCDCDPGYEPAADDETSCVASGDDHDHAARGGRLLVSDGASGRVVVVDLERGEAIASLATEDAARVYPSSDGMRGFAVQSSADAVQGIDPGLSYEDHGDHVDAKTAPPSVLSEIVVSCSRPVHFVAHGGHGATFCDGDGMLHVFEDTGSGETFDVDTFDSGRAHHGVGLVAFDHVLLSTPNPEDEEDSLPIGVRALDFDGTEVATFDECPGLHGEAATHEHVCFGCSDGVMCLERSDIGELSSVKLTHPEGTDDGVRVGTLAAAEHEGVLVGNWGEDLVMIDPKDGLLTPIAVGESYLAFKLTEDGEHVLVLTDSGELHEIETSSGESVATAVVFPEFEREPGHEQLRPNFVVGADHVYVIDPRHPEVLELDLDTLELTERVIDLEEGQFHSLALVAQPPEDAHE